MNDKYDKLIDLSKRRGIFWNSFEIYGGSAGFFDYGPVGCIIKKNIENTWREFFLIQEGYMEIESPTVGIENIYIASGHTSNFSDPLCECEKCHQSYRADHIIEMSKVSVISFVSSDIKQLTQIIKEYNLRCPECNGKLSDVYNFNLMFQTNIGPNREKKSYLRPETAQGIFINFQRLSNYYHNKLPFGCIQIGKSYRNEISPRQGLLRLREFTQAECEIFVDPENKQKNCSIYENIILTLLPNQNKDKPIICTLKEAIENNFFAHSYLAYYIGLTHKFLTNIGIKECNLRFRQHKKNEMAHYAIDCWDAEINTERFGWVEVVGIADRTDYDLKSHIKQSTANLTIYKEFKTEKTINTEEIYINEKEIGKQYKKKSKEIISLLKNIDKKELLNHMNNESITIKINNEIYNISKKFISFRNVKKKITGIPIIPHVIEPSYGIDRIFYCVLENSYSNEMIINKNNKETRTILKLVPKIAPYKVSINPLIQNENLCTIAKEIFQKFKNRNIIAFYDESGSIGKRYRRNDEIGIPYSITIDFQTIEDNTVTIRYRDDMKQIRKDINDTFNYIKY